MRAAIKHQECATDTPGKWLGRQRYLYRYVHHELDRQKWLEVADVTWEKRETGLVARKRLQAAAPRREEE